ncbi:MAG: MFS transporter [Flavobacteriales bacterium]|nr:MFS transporter [Flavobacteriales bacterium]
MKNKYSKNFWLMCLAMFFFMTSFNLILPELNNYISILDGADKKGLIITLFTISAAISRPFSGKLADTIGRKKVIYLGIICSFFVMLIYPFSYSVLFFLILRFLHGFSAGFAPTGATALLTDLIPEKSRGHAMGIWGTFISLGIGVGQTLGSWIYLSFGFTILFLIGALFSLIAFILVFWIKETLVNQQEFNFKLLRISWQDVFEPNVLPAAFVMLLSAMCSGMIFVLTPDLSTYLGISNKGFFFGIYVIATILIRLLTSSLSDRIGREKTLLIGCFILVISMLLVGTSNSIVSYIFAAIIFGIATGITSPTMFAWTADLSHEDRRGVGAGTMFIALEFGIMFGALLTLVSYDSTKSTIFITFLIGAVMATIACIYLIVIIARKKKVSALN